MPKLSQYRETYYAFSAKLSDVSRSLAFAGLAIVWIFKVDTGTGPRPPETLLAPAILLGLGLALDLLQYLAQTTVWGIFQWHHDRKLRDPATEDPDLDAPSWLRWPGFIFFVTKLAVVMVGYCLLLAYLLSLWRPTSVGAV